MIAKNLAEGLRKEAASCCHDNHITAKNNQRLLLIKKNMNNNFTIFTKMESLHFVM